jgi:hypothetical protein
MHACDWFFKQLCFKLDYQLWETDHYLYINRDSLLELATTFPRGTDDRVGAKFHHAIVVTAASSSRKSILQIMLHTLLSQMMPRNCWNRIVAGPAVAYVRTRRTRSLCGILVIADRHHVKGRGKSLPVAHGGDRAGPARCKLASSCPPLCCSPGPPHWARLCFRIPPRHYDVSLPCLLLPALQMCSMSPSAVS